MMEFGIAGFTLATAFLVELGMRRFTWPSVLSCSGDLLYLAPSRGGVVTLRFQIHWYTDIRLFIVYTGDKGKGY